MVGSSIVLEAIQERGHQASMYPTGHTDIHLADVVFFNIGDKVWERRPQAFNDIYLEVLNYKSLFGCQIMADLFAQIVFHVNMGNQSRKDKHLPPCTTAAYQPIQPTTDKEYNEQYMVAIMFNPPASTPATNTVVNCTINAISICPLNIDSCEDLTGFAFEFRNSLTSANGSGSISTHSRLLYLSVVDTGMTSSQRDPLSHSVFLLSEPHFLSTI
ncbi:hypothetical protein DSO57_1037904 [Entomophthora muscae]|uniref:Uncharacterized protein n=1 Tax=Entomophthora muscae TaxID=34485 RepID=A0ACC2S0S8_9FUNG|nr:hypothetical protein DSO57_1037904 [Entomophthora muscae]